MPARPDPSRSARGRHRGVAVTGAGEHAWRQPLQVGAKVLAALISAALLLGFGYGWWSYRDLNDHLTRLNVISAPKASKPDIDGTDQNILLVGNDDRSNMTDNEVRAFKVGRDGGSMATDTMMIVHVPADGSRASIISLPRDAYVDIPGYKKNKLNAAYVDGYYYSGGSEDEKRAAGAKELRKTVEQLTGLHIDHYVQVSLLGFVRISNAIGGVPVNLCHAVNDTVAYNESIGQSGGSGLVLSAGKHTIHGVQALEFVRQRHNIPGGDLGREKRQRYFLTAAFRTVASAGTLLNPGRLHALIKAIQDSIYVDTDFDVLKLAEQVSELNADNIKGEQIPTTGTSMIDGVGSVELVDPAQVQQFVKNMIGEGEAELGSVAAADPAAVTVHVVGGAGGASAAQLSAKRLLAYGFTASYADATSAQAATTVRYADGMQAEVKALLKYLPADVVLQQSDVPVLTLVLGSDGLAVKAKHHAAHSGTSASGSATAAAKSRPIDSGCID